MKRESLKVDKRDIQGKAVKKLRREGILPANIFGKGFESTAVQLPLKEFTEIYDKVGETGLVDITLGSDTIPVLIHNAQINPRTQMVVHADFFKVNLKEKIIAYIPIVGTGEAIAVRDNLGILLQQLSDLEVEALPTDLPEKIEVDITDLAEVGAQIVVSNLKIPAEVTAVTDANQTVFRIGEAVQEEPEPEPEAPAEGEEGAAPAEGEAPAESGGAGEGEEKAETPAEAEKESGKAGE